MTINEIGETKVILTEEDAKVFLAFKKHREKFLIMLQHGVFDLHSGKAEINCNDGHIQVINIHTRTYKRAVGNGNIPV